MNILFINIVYNINFDLINCRCSSVKSFSNIEPFIDVKLNIKSVRKSFLLNTHIIKYRTLIILQGVVKRYHRFIFLLEIATENVINFLPTITILLFLSNILQLFFTISWINEVLYFLYYVRKEYFFKKVRNSILNVLLS